MLDREENGNLTSGMNRPIDLVDSGSFTVSAKTNLKLSALLGTCVGLAIVDRVAGIGGLYHILLPEPTGIAEVWDPHNYAATGTPFFIQALLEEGASLENMRAVVAGGALVGPISMADLQLDIGGRIVDIVLDMLKKAGIAIESAETGGYFSCKIILDLNKLEVSVQPISHIDDRRGAGDRKISLADIDETIRHISPIPQTALKIMRIINDPDYKLREVAREIRHDQVLSAKVLNVCNSVSYSPVKRIDSIDQALVMLGKNLIFQLVISAALEDILAASDKGYSMCKGGLFRHSWGTAIVSERLAKLTGKAPPEVAYTAGLLHDIGKVVLDQSVIEILPAFYRKLYTEGVDLVNVEDEMLGINHSQVGEKLAERWLLPDNLKEVIAKHHNPEKAVIAPELTNIVNIANLMVSRFQVGKILERNSTEGLAESMAVLGLKLDQFPEMVDFVPWKTIEEQMLF